ncbi:MAG TPA: hypothetical protein VGV61_05205 [Thermoanaerobaculia bacterium]|nr:hypothetical protein [Thermoanaerobaculia bacterium]
MHRTIAALLVVSCLMASPAVAQLSLAWTRTWPSDGSSFGASDLVVDRSGNVYVTAVLRDPITHITYCALAKYSSAGTQLWEKRIPIIPGSSSSIIPDPHLKLDSQGNVIMTHLKYTESTDLDCAVTSFDANGNERWSQTFDPSTAGSYATINSCDFVTVDPADNVIVFGAGDGALWTIKYSQTGAQQWATELDTNFVTYPFGLAAGLDGSAYVLTNWPDGFGGDDIVLIKYDSNGNQQWIQRYDSTSGGDDWPGEVAVDSAGNVVVVGYGALGEYQRPYRYDIITLKYSAAGQSLWQKRYENGVPQAGPGDVYDLWRAAVTFDAQGNILVTSRSPGETSKYDYAVVKYDSNGNEIWVRRYAGPANCDDEASDVVTGGNGRVFITGFSETSCGSVPTPRQLYIAEYDAAGNFLGSALENEPSRGEYGIASWIAVDDNGNVYSMIRSQLRKYAGGWVPAPPLYFRDGFESGDLSAWSLSWPRP